ncbi:conserved hypothetical protein [Halorhabdus utahensis DSM 12940]|uniref:Glycoside hydrolase family 5 domain-containing protein n=1 Tax=Halorhabdus utahensis (strain DSM 12940 / JCM 11049 / AX-2) TaxID=519442 RepID=C7NUV0_HALUD|nr:hypothetical protein [Halorhabdus utahensis]ACV11113.1 conserved hypothetical protein [Halorhabdus utahensis DSM 12940]
MFGDQRHTHVGIDGDVFTINGQRTYAGRTHEGQSIEGLLFNARLVHAIFDDENPETVDNWAYPDTGEWDPERNVSEFLGAMPTWRKHGLRAIATNLQCGSPEGYSESQPWTVSAYRPDGTLKPVWMGRLERVLDRADELGMAVILGLFYFGQDDVLADETSVIRAVDEVMAWLHEKEYTNVVLEVANECDINYDHAILQPERITELIERIRETEHDGHRYPVGTSFSGGVVPTDDVIDASDLVLLHGNNVDDPERIREMVAEVRSAPTYEPMPIVFNEDDHFRFGSDSNMLAALESGASWGYFDPGENDYWHGYQSPPVRWDPNTARKRAFFAYLDGVTDPDGR